MLFRSSENPKRIAPHRDYEISMERSKCLDRYFEDESELKVVKFEFATFSGGRFPSPDALKIGGTYSLWFGGSIMAPHFQLFNPLA